LEEERKERDPHGLGGMLQIGLIRVEGWEV
jgi:hypothetical protein